MYEHERCTNCEEPISGTPVYFDGHAYCCAGCVAGGPCVCANAPRATPAGSRALTPLDAPAPARPAPPPGSPRPRGAPPPVGDGRAIVLRIGGFDDQRSLLEFASRLEREASLSDVALTRAEPADAWFSLRAASAQQVCVVLEGMHPYRIRASAVQSSVDAQVLPRTAGDRPGALATPSERESADAVLPPRARLRVFSPANGPQPAPGTSAGPDEPDRTAREALLKQSQVSASGPSRSPRPAPGPARPAPASPPPSLPPGPRRPPATIRPETPEPVGPRSGMVSADDRRGGAAPISAHLTLVVYPFHSFVALNDFQSAVRALHGVRNTRVRRFYRGTLHLAVDYEDIVPLSERLADLRGFRWQIVSESRDEIELALEESGSLVAAEGDG